MSKRTRRGAWTEEETFLLIDIIAQKNLMQHIDGHRGRNQKCYQIIADEFVRKNIACDWRRVSNRWKSLRCQYYRILKASPESEDQSVTWPFYKKIHNLLFGSPMIKILKEKYMVTDSTLQLERTTTILTGGYGTIGSVSDSLMKPSPLLHDNESGPEELPSASSDAYISTSNMVKPNIEMAVTDASALGNECGTTGSDVDSLAQSSYKSNSENMLPQLPTITSVSSLSTLKIGKQNSEKATTDSTPTDCDQRIIERSADVLTQHSLLSGNENMPQVPLSPSISRNTTNASNPGKQNTDSSTEDEGCGTSAKSNGDSPQSSHISGNQSEPQLPSVANETQCSTVPSSGKRNTDYEHDLGNLISLCTEHCDRDREIRQRESERRENLLMKMYDTVRESIQYLRSPHESAAVLIQMPSSLSSSVDDGAAGGKRKRRADEAAWQRKRNKDADGWDRFISAYKEQCEKNRAARQREVESREKVVMAMTEALKDTVRCLVANEPPAMVVHIPEKSNATL